MPYCRNCGTQLPQEAGFCPNCGASVEAKPQVRPKTEATVPRYIVIGLLGAFLSVIMSFFIAEASPDLNAFFIPPFVASIIIIIAYRIDEVKDSLITSFTIYLFTEGIIGGLVLGTSYALQVPYEIVWSPEIWEVALYSFTPISAILAAYIGIRIGPKRKEQMLTPRRERKGPGGVIYSA